MVSLEANAQLCCDHRCWEDCLSRELTCRDAPGQEIQKTQQQKPLKAKGSDTGAAPANTGTMAWRLCFTSTGETQTS